MKLIYIPILLSLLVLNILISGCSPLTEFSSDDAEEELELDNLVILFNHLANDTMLANIYSDARQKMPNYDFRNFLSDEIISINEQNKNYNLSIDYFYLSMNAAAITLNYDSNLTIAAKKEVLFEIKKSLEDKWYVERVALVGKTGEVNR